MAYTKSKDGISRTTVKVEFRLTKEEIKLLKAYAKMKRAGVEDWKDLLFYHGQNWTEYLCHPNDDETLSKEYIKAWSVWQGNN